MTTGTIMAAELPFDIVELVPCPQTPELLPESGGPLPELAFRVDAWTPVELGQLRTLFAADQGIPEIAEALGRTPNAVRTKICDLGLRRRSARPWNELEDEVLVQRYGTAAAAALALELGRSVPAVYVRAGLLGLTESNPPSWTAWEDAQLRAGYQQDVAVPELARLIGRPAGGVIGRARSLGFRHPGHPPGWTDDELTRALALAAEGVIYKEIARRLAAEGFPPRSKQAVEQALWKAGYQRGWGRAWLPEEDDALRAAYAAGAKLRELAVRLGRNRGSLAWRAGEIGLQGCHPNPDGWRGRVWTDEEDAFLKANYGRGGMKSPDIAEALGRTKAAVFNRAWALGLEHGYGRAWTAQEDRAIRIAYGVGLSLTDLAAALGRDASVVSKRAKRQLGLDFCDRPNRAPRGPRRSRTPLTLAGILAMEGQGPVWTAADIAATAREAAA